MQTQSLDPAARIDELVESRSNEIPEPLHGPQDPDKLDALVADLRERGWQGPPIVADGNRAITGSHRLAACRQVSNDDDIEIEVDVVELAELCAVFGLDWQAHLDKHLQGNPGNGWYEAVVALDEHLPLAVVDYLGLDVH